MDTIWFEDAASPAVASVLYIIKPFVMLLTCCMFPAIATPSPVVCVDGVDGWEFEGPKVFPVPVLFAAPDEVVCFLFLLFYMKKEIAEMSKQIICRTSCVNANGPKLFSKNYEAGDIIFP